MKKFEIILVVITLFFLACGDEESITNSAELSAAKEKAIRKHNIELAKEQSNTRNVCDTLALEEYILEHYPAGTHLMRMNKTSIYEVPKKAVIYYEDKCSRNKYIFTCIVKSKECERFVEPNNLIGYDASFINLDSTKLGTALFYLTLFECNKDESFRRVWEKSVPSQGGFNTIKLKRWKPRNIEYIELNFIDGIISGNRNYNYFILDDIEMKPHLIETYQGIGHRRTLAEINDDIIPDYYEYRFRHNENTISVRDSIPFYWDIKKCLYVTKVNKKWFRKY
ncbi:MAG: hypothetical protein ABFS12_17680 [Bacteroidota bacterium]